LIIYDYTFDKDALFAGINLKGDELAVITACMQPWQRKSPA
jgi:hypothetical protein